MKAQIIPGEEWSCGDWEREWAVELLLSSSVPMCWGTFFPNLINLPSFPLSTAQEANPKPKSKHRGEPMLQQRWEIGSGCEKVSPPVCAICKLSPASRLLKRQVVHCQTCSNHLILFYLKREEMCFTFIRIQTYISNMPHIKCFTACCCPLPQTVTVPAGKPKNYGRFRPSPQCQPTCRQWNTTS